MAKKLAPPSLPRDPARQRGVTMKLAPNGMTDATRYVLEIDRPFWAHGPSTDEPIQADRGTFWLEIAVDGGHAGVQVLPAGETPRPFNPFCEPATGRWSPVSPAGHPPEVWFCDFVRDLLEPETRLGDQHPRIVDRSAAAWHARHPARWSAASERRLELLGEPAGKRLELLSESRQRVQLFETSSGYQPEASLLPLNLDVPEAAAVTFRGNQTHRLIVGGRAAEKLFEHIGWGRETESNRVEQGGLLLGRVLEDRQKGRVEARVEDVAPANLARGSSVHLDFPTQAWKEMLDYVDRLENAGSPRLNVIGWYHTHPGQLDVFMSATDQETQRRLFNQDWQFSVVLNPNRKEFRVYHGMRSEECQGAIAPPNGGSREHEELQPELQTARPPTPDGGEEAPRARRRWYAPFRRLARFRWWIAGIAAAGVIAAVASLLPRAGASLAARRPASGEKWGEIRGVRLHRSNESLTGPSAPLLAGDRLQTLSGPERGWYQVERRSVGWIRADEYPAVNRAKDHAGPLDSVATPR
ncbi:MAG TPA: hypothetical protein VNW71_02925 [Thermoanaerobaculia bacterium]|nr:hypothetical protein [Thermoanaerobaculia bacterium]